MGVIKKILLGVVIVTTAAYVLLFTFAFSLTSASRNLDGTHMNIGERLDEAALGTYVLSGMAVSSFRNPVVLQAEEIVPMLKDADATSTWLHERFRLLFYSKVCIEGSLTSVHYYSGGLVLTLNETNSTTSTGIMTLSIRGEKMDMYDTRDWMKSNEFADLRTYLFHAVGSQIRLYGRFYGGVVTQHGSGIPQRYMRIENVYRVNDRNIP